MARKQSSIVEVNWEGKYLPDGSRRELVLPGGPDLQILETHGSGAAGMLLHGDNLQSVAALLPKLRGKVKLVYLDPPFNLGRPHEGTIRISGEGAGGDHELRIRCYEDSWGKGEASFAHQLWLRVRLAHELLAPDGTIFLHGNDHTAPLLRALLDDVFGADRFLNQIVWHYTGGGRSRSAFSNKHDIIFWYAKGAKHTFNGDAVRVPYKPTSGYAKGGITSRAGKKYQPHPDGTIVDDVWDIPIVNPMSHERTGYAAQKPVALLERIVGVASNPGELIADLYAGSGTTAVAAHRLGRNWLACDGSQLAVHHARSRLLNEGAGFSLYQLAQTEGRPGKVRVRTLGQQVRLESYSPPEDSPLGKLVSLESQGTNLLEAWCILRRAGAALPPTVVAATNRNDKGHMERELRITKNITADSLAIAVYDALGNRTMTDLNGG